MTSRRTRTGAEPMRAHKPAINQAAILLALGAMFVAPVASAQVIVPNVNAVNHAGGGLNSTTRQFERTYQAVIPESELLAITFPNNVINGIAWRSYFGGGLWPALDINWANFDIYLSHSPANVGPLVSNVFADHQGGDLTLVRGGAFTITAGSYAAGNGVGNPAGAWAPYIDFTTPFTYLGGNLTLTVRHDGNDGGTAQFVDENTASPFGAGNWSHYASTAQPGSYSATTSNANRNGILVTNFRVVPGPATLALLGLGGLVAFRRRR